MSQTGSVSIPLFCCVFNQGTSVTHWSVSFDRALYDALPHLYLVCLADNTVRPRKIVGAFMVKTSRHHNDADFLEAMLLALVSFEKLKPLVDPQTSMLPARIGLAGPPPSEEEFVRLAFQQYTKFSAGGTA